MVNVHLEEGLYYAMEGNSVNVIKIEGDDFYLESNVLEIYLEGDVIAMFDWGKVLYVTMGD